MSLASLSIRRPVATAMIYLAVVVLGSISFSRLSIDLLPDIAFPRLTVYTTYPNVGPAEVERFITEPVERAVARVPGVQRVSSVSTQGASLVTIRFVWDTDMDFATLNVRERLDQLRYELPLSAGRPTILRTDPGSEPILAIAAAGPDLVVLKDLADDVFRRRLEQVDGIAQATVVGGLEREIQVQVDPRKLETFGVAIEEVARALEAANYSAPGGTIRRGQFRYALRALGEFQSVDEIGTTVVKRDPGGAQLLLRDIATVEDGFAERETIARYNGRESVGILAFKEAGANTVRVTREVGKVLDQLRREYRGVDLEIASAQARFISDAISNVVQALMLGGLLAFLVLFLFLHDPRYPVAIAIAIPLSVAVAFALLYVAGVSLNVMSLGGLALGVGMLVDSSIVVLENAFRHRQRGLAAAEAATVGAEEVQAAITAATLTTVAVFLPVIYVKGVAGGLFEDLSLAVTFSLLASLAVALSLLPVILSRLRSRAAGPSGATKGAGEPGRAALGWRPLRDALSALRSLFDASDRAYDRFARRYERLLVRSLDRKGTVAAVALVSIVVALAVAWMLRRDVLPPVDEGEFRVRLVLPLGTGLSETERVAWRVEERLRADEDVRAVFSRVGRSRGGEVAEEGVAGVNTGLLDVRLREGASTAGVAARVQANLPPLPPDALAIETGRATALGRALGVAEADLAVRVRGADLEAAATVAQEVRDRLARVPRLGSVRVGFRTGQPEIRIEVNRERAAHHGLTVRRVADAVQAFLAGVVPTQFVDFTEKVNIVVRAPDAVRRDLTSLLNFSISGTPLRELITIREVVGPVEVLRDGQDRIVPVYADVARGGLGDALAAAHRALAGLRVPQGLRIEIGGENEEMRESFRSLVFAFLLALFLVYLILAAQFESLVHPFTILCSVPLAAIGAVLALAITGHGLNVMSLIGVVILVGIVVNNAIVEVDFANRARRAGTPLREAVLEAARVRLRPILITTVTTVLGLLPMALGVGAGADLRAPLAVALIGGLISSTLLTLVVVPVLYEWVEGLRAKLAVLPFIARYGRPRAVAADPRDVADGPADAAGRPLVAEPPDDP